MPISVEAPQSIRKVEAEARTRNEVWRLPPAPKASPQPMTVSCIAPILALSQHGATVNAPLGISADSSRLAWARPGGSISRLMPLGSLAFCQSGCCGSNEACQRARQPRLTEPIRQLRATSGAPSAACKRPGKSSPPDRAQSRSSNTSSCRCLSATNCQPRSRLRFLPSSSPWAPCSGHRRATT